MLRAAAIDGSTGVRRESMAQGSAGRREIRNYVKYLVSHVARHHRPNSLNISGPHPPSQLFKRISRKLGKEKGKAGHRLWPDAS